MKNTEKSGKQVFDDIPMELHPLDRACRLHEKAVELGWVWNSCSDAADKVREEIAEAEEAASQADRNHLIEECGDVLFSALSYIKFLGVDPTEALDRANRKFYERFSFMVRRMDEEGIPFDSDHQAEADSFWKEAKRTGL